MKPFVYAQSSKIFTAISKGELSYVQEFLANGGDINTTGIREMTLLYYSIVYNQTPIAMMLIEAGADINKPERDGRTPFYLALSKKNETITQALMERNAALDANPDWSKPFRPIILIEIVPSKCISDPHQTWTVADTHPVFLPYIEKYLSIKKNITGREELDYPIKILFYRSDSEVWRQISRLAQRFTFQGVASAILSSRHILVNYDAWMTFPEAKKELYIFHELGHVDLDQAHAPKETISIMNPFYIQDLSLQEIDINQDPTLQHYLYEELFSKRRNLRMRRQYIEGQIYPTHLLSNDPKICPVPTKLYLDETN